MASGAHNDADILQAAPSRRSRRLVARSEPSCPSSWSRCTRSTARCASETLTLQAFKAGCRRQSDDPVNVAVLSQALHQRPISCTTNGVQVLGEADVSVKGMLEEFGVYLKPAAFKQDVKPLLKDSCSAVFGSATGLTDMLVQHMPLSRVGTAAKVGI